MPTKKIKYTTRIPFFSNTNNLNNEEAEDPNISEEPEHFKYGVYFNDGYDYMRHMVSIDDFNDEEKDLKKLNSERKPISSNLTKPSKSATVIKEFDVDDQSVPGSAIEKLKEIANNEIDGDVLKALEGDEEYSDLEDNFIELADNIDTKPVIKGDQELFNLFLGNTDEMEDGGFNENTNCDFLKSIDSMNAPINELSEYINFENAYNQTKNFDLNFDSRSQQTKLSKCFINALERTNAGQEKNKFINENTEENDFNKYIYRGETEYIEEDIDNAVDEWACKGPVVDSIADKSNNKIKKNQFKLMTIENAHRSTSKHEPMEVNDEEELAYTDVSKYHVPRQKNETTEERKDRKNALKVAKRCRREEKKISRSIIKSLKQ